MCICRIHDLQNNRLGHGNCIDIYCRCVGCFLINGSSSGYKCGSVKPTLKSAHKWIITSRKKAVTVTAYPFVDFSYNTFMIGVQTTNRHWWSHTLTSADNFMMAVAGTMWPKGFYLRGLCPEYNCKPDCHIRFVNSYMHRAPPKLGSESSSLNLSLPGLNGRHFADDIFKWIFTNENISISIRISLKFVHRVQSRIRQHWFR